MPPVTEFGNKVRSARARLRMSQSEFAKHLGVPVGTLQHWELASQPKQPRGLGRRLIEEQLDRILAAPASGSAAHRPAKQRRER